MKIMIIKCKEIDDQHRHSLGLQASDRTLCGIAFEGMGGGFSSQAIIKNGTINCPDCIDIIDFCKNISEKNIKR